MGHGSRILGRGSLFKWVSGSRVVHDRRGLALSERVVVTTWSLENLSWVDVQHLGGVAAGNGNKATRVHLARHLHSKHGAPR